MDNCARILVYRLWVEHGIRLELRLVTEFCDMSGEFAAQREDNTAERVGRTIDGAYEDVLRDQRLRAAEELIAMNVEVPSDPAELSRRLATAHDTCGIR